MVIILIIYISSFVYSHLLPPVQNDTAVTPTVPINVTMETASVAAQEPESPAAVTSQSDNIAETIAPSLLTSSPEEPPVSSNATEQSPTQTYSTTLGDTSNLSHQCKCVSSVCQSNWAFTKPRPLNYSLDKLYRTFHYSEPQISVCFNRSILFWIGKIL